MAQTGTGKKEEERNHGQGYVKRKVKTVAENKLRNKSFLC
jgi:hypothetical protein